MGEVSQVLKREQIEYQGTKYLLVRPSFDIEALFENWLEERALDKIVRRRYLMGEDVFLKAMSAWEKDCAAGEYAFQGATGDKAYHGDEGFKYLMFLMTCESNKSMTKDLFDMIFKERGNDFVMAWNRLNSATPTTPPPEEGAKDSAS